MKTQYTTTQLIKKINKAIRSASARANEPLSSQLIYKGVEDVLITLRIFIKLEKLNRTQTNQKILQLAEEWVG